MSGYRNLKVAGRMGSITAVKQELTAFKLNLHERHFSSAVMGAGLSRGELVVRQYLLVRIGGISLNKALLLSAGKPNSKVVYYMPSAWFGILEKHGFQVDRWRSSVLWGLYVCLLLIYGLIKITNVVSKYFFKKNSHLQRVKPHAYFADLELSNLPSSNKQGIGRNIIWWYARWKGKSSDIEAIHHSVAKSSTNIVGDFELAYQSGPLPDLTSVNELVRFIMWSVIALLISSVDLLRGRWWHAFSLNQAALAAQLRIVPSRLLAKEYFFHNSNWIYRPLWTYEAEQNGALIYFYFYSTNIRSFNDINKYLPPPYGWKASNWPCYLVWNHYQEKFLRRATGSQFKVLIVGEIWFNDEETDTVCISKFRTIAVFDVQPQRASIYRLLGLDYEYYIPQVALPFLEDIQAVLNEFGLDMAIKRKREIGKLAHPIYRSATKKIELRENVISISPTISASRVIEKSLAVISMPFTSTALIGVHQGKPSVYYDASAKVLRDDYAAHGIPVLIGKDELRAWVRNILK